MTREEAIEIVKEENRTSAWRKPRDFSQLAAQSAEQAERFKLLAEVQMEMDRKQAIELQNLQSVSDNNFTNCEKP